MDRVGQKFVFVCNVLDTECKSEHCLRELRMSGFRIHSHAQLSSCGYLGTPETAKLLHSTPACVCEG